MIIPPAARTASVKEYYFSVKNRQIAEMNADGRSEPVINLGIGSPDGFPPMEAVQSLRATAMQKDAHKYQSYNGIPELREAFAEWYRRWYGVSLDPKSEIQPLTGSKEGILLVCLAFLDKGDGILIPDPGYPTYSSAASLCEARIIPYDLTEENGFYPDFEALERSDLRGVKLMFTNYPGMPSGAPATRALYERLVDFGRNHGIMICNDNPYSFILNDTPLSILSVPGAKECCLELNSLSKAHNMAGWRVGMVAAASDVICEILKVKSQMDSGMFRGIQTAAIAALQSGPQWFEELNKEYRARKAEACRIMDLLGARYNPDAQGLFVWGHVDGDARELSDRLLMEAGVFITPGFIFGRNGREYLRISLCATPQTLREAYARIKAVL